VLVTSTTSPSLPAARELFLRGVKLTVEYGRDRRIYSRRKCIDSPDEDKSENICAHKDKSTSWLSSFNKVETKIVGIKTSTLFMRNGPAEWGRK
jgi:hypothetical protein